MYLKDLYLNILYEAGFVTCIDKYARVTDISESVNDHIFVKHYDYRDVFSAILKTDVTILVTVAKINYLHTDTQLQSDNNYTYVDTKVLIQS